MRSNSDLSTTWSLPTYHWDYLWSPNSAYTFEIILVRVYSHAYVCVCLCMNISVCACEWVSVCVWAWVCMCVCGVHHGICVWVRGLLMGSGFLSPCGSWGIKLRGQRLGARTFYTESFHQLVCCFILKKGCKNVFCDWVDLCLGLTVAGYNLQHLFLSACYFQGQQKEGGHGFLWVSTPFLLLSFFLLHFYFFPFLLCSF